MGQWDSWDSTRSFARARARPRPVLSHLSHCPKVLKEKASHALSVGHLVGHLSELCPKKLKIIQ
jgi:hypothetical protein